MPFHRINTSNSSTLLRLTVLLSSCLMTATSMSFFSLDMRTPKKCVVVDYPGIVVDVHYEVFDANKGRMDAGVRMPELLVSPPVEIEIFPPDESRIKRTRENHITKNVSDMEGKFEYSTTGSGTIHICAMIKELKGRKYPRPTLVGLRIKESGNFEETIGVNAEEQKEHENGQRAARKHFSEMEKVLINMIQDTEILLKNAEMIKDEEAAFHKKSLEMNSASKWWPMMHVVVLLVTGFTQANHVIKFFKSMHII